MTSSTKRLLCICAIAGALSLAGCERQAGEPPTSLQATARTPGALSRTDGAEADATAGQAETTQIDPAPAPRAPLDLSLPAQPAAEFGSLEGTATPKRPLLPDLFGDTGKPAQNDINLKGSLFMSDTEREDREAVDGGQVTIELKTR